MKKIILQGRGVIDGVVKAQAVVFPDSIGGNTGSLGDTDGVIYEKGNINYGVSIKDKILVIPCARGSNGFSAHFKGSYVAGVRPAGWISTKIDGRLAVALASMNVPSIVDFEGDDPIVVIETGDMVTMNGTTGEVIIEKKS